MVEIVYPIELPQRPMTDGYQQTIGQSEVIVSDMDTGPSKRRRRSLANPIPYKMSFVLNLQQVKIFSDWYENTLGGGVLPFSWVHPITREPAYFQFSNPSERPTISAYNGSGIYFLLSIQLNMLP